MTWQGLLEGVAFSEGAASRGLTALAPAGGLLASYARWPQRHSYSCPPLPGLPALERP